MREPIVTSRIVADLNAVPGCYAKKRHSGKFQSGEPDVTGCFLGQAFYLETKMTGGALTQLQAHQLELWRGAGATANLAVYDESDRSLHVIYLHDSEKWTDFVGAAKLRELADSTVKFWKAPIRTYPWTAWLDERVRSPE